MENIEMVETVEIKPEDLTEEQKQNALIFYARQLTKLRKYNKLHKDEINEKSKQNYQRIREDPELYEAYKQRKRELYRRKNPKN